MEITTRRRRALSTALALLLVVESVSAMAAVAVVGRDADTGSRHELPSAAPAGVVDAVQGAPAALAPVVAAVRVRTVNEDPDTAGAGPIRTTAAPAPARAFAPRVAISSVKAPKSRRGSSGGSSSASTASSGSYKGRNHFWFPSIGVNRTVYAYSCARKSALANLVYRWGCGGTNNIYLMGHAWGVFKPLHDAYVSGRLRAGMRAYYADAAGRTHTYVVKWWKLTRPTTAAKWAWASQSVPSMTLQTCVGANSEYRVMVRLVEVR
jgi:hypothetical protein